MVKKKVKANLIGQMVQIIKETSIKILFMGKEFINGQIIALIMANDKIIKCTVKGNFNGMMVEFIKGIMLMI